MTKLVAPFPYYGGKRRHTAKIWELLGDPQAYVEPFCGSAAVLLQRPESAKQRRRELINDNMGWVANFWRAVKHAPDEVAEWMDWPNTQVDLAARQQWFDTHVEEEVNTKLRTNPEWYDPKLAGVWAWGVSNSIRMNYPSGTIEAQPFTKNYRAANQRHMNLAVWCQKLSDRLRYVQIHAGDWELCLRPAAHMQDGQTVGVFLDPPYNPAKTDSSMYQHGETWQKAADWAFDKGDDPLYRIILCGYQGSYKTPKGWTYQTLGDVGRKSSARKLVEGIWLSPAINMNKGTLI